MIDNFKDIAYIIGAIITFLVGRKSTTLTNKGTEIDNLTKYQLMYDKFVEQFTDQYKGLEKHVDELSKEVRNLELRNAVIIEESQTWQKRFNDLQKLYDKLKQEFDNYKKNHG